MYQFIDFMLFIFIEKNLGEINTRLMTLGFTKDFTDLDKPSLVKLAYDGLVRLMQIFTTVPFALKDDDWFKSGQKRPKNNQWDDVN